MSHVIKTTVYQYDELTPEAQEKARDWFRSASEGDNFYSEYVTEDATTIGALMGITIDNVYWSGFWSQGDGACFIGSYRYTKGATKAIKAYAPQDKELHRIAEELQSLQRKNFYSLTARMAHRGRYQHSGCMSVDVEDSRDQYRATPEDDLTQLMRDFADWIYKQLKSAYEYDNSDESVSKNIRCNEYTFTESGKRYG
jgi:hypothetical protein